MKSLLRKCKIATLPISIFILGFTSVVSSASVTLLDSINTGVTSGSTSTNNNTNFNLIDLNDSANFLAVVVSGESFNMDFVTFGGVSMTLSASRANSYTKTNIYTLFNPNLSGNQTLAVQADYQLTQSAYTAQYYSFSNVASIGDTPTNTGTAATISLDFGSVTEGSYLLMTGSDNNADIDFAGDITLVDVLNGPGGWDSQTAGMAITTSSPSAIYNATSGTRMAISGLELIAVPEPSAVALVGLAGMLLLLRRCRHA